MKGVCVGYLVFLPDYYAAIQRYTAHTDNDTGGKKPRIIIGIESQK